MEPTWHEGEMIFPELLFVSLLPFCFFHLCEKEATASFSAAAAAAVAAVSFELLRVFLRVYFP